MNYWIILKRGFGRILNNEGGFDIIIGNPPYVKEYTNKEIFDPVKNEIGGLYMGREIVIIFDIFDAYFIKLSTLFGFPHFFALTHYLSLILIIFLMIYISYKYFDKPLPYDIQKPEF